MISYYYKKGFDYECLNLGSSEKSVLWLMECHNIEFKELEISEAVCLPLHCHDHDLVVAPFSESLAQNLLW